jgi:hypothetical protein
MNIVVETYNKAIMVDVVSRAKQQPIEKQKPKESKHQTHLLHSHTATTLLHTKYYSISMTFSYYLGSIYRGNFPEFKISFCT